MLLEYKIRVGALWEERNFLESKRRQSSFVVCPHPKDFHNVTFFEDLINEAMLNVDAARIRSGQITNELLVSRRSLERVEFKDFEQFFGL